MAYVLKKDDKNILFNNVIKLNDLRKISKQINMQILLYDRPKSNMF